MVYYFCNREAAKQDKLAMFRDKTTGTVLPPTPVKSWKPQQKQSGGGKRAAVVMNALFIFHFTEVIYYTFGGNQTIQIQSNFQGFPFY